MLRRTPAREFSHAHAMSAPKRIRANSTCSCAMRAWHASRALGEGAYPRHAGQSLHAHGAAGAAAPPAPTRSRRERPQASHRSQAAASGPHSGHEWQLSFRHCRSRSVTGRHKPRSGTRCHRCAEAPYAWSKALQVSTCLKIVPASSHTQHKHDKGPT